MSDARTVITEYLNSSLSKGGQGWTTQQHADAILAALADAGLVVVPREPSPELCFKILAALPSDWTGFQAEDIKELWRAMVGAANEQ
jgi:hypothetical protein